MIIDGLASLLAQISRDVQDIEIVKAAVYASSVGSLLYVLRLVPARVLAWFKHVFICSIEVSNNDGAYIWLQKWLATRAFSKRARRRIITTNNYQERDGDGEHYDEDFAASSIAYKPNIGSYIIRYRGYPIVLNFDRERIEERNMFSESLHISCAFRKKLLEDLVEEAAKYARQQAKTSLCLYRANGHYWDSMGNKPFRPLSSLVYADNLAQTLLLDAKKFFGERSWYQTMGIPWRRGYLLHGPPGNGKTSLAYALASELELDIYCLNLTDSGLSNEGLLDLLAQVPEKSMVLIEEIDEAFDKKPSKHLSHTGLLNALDGVVSKEGRITLMTSNYMERISPALIRPGRADLHLYVGNVTQEQARRMFERFYPNKLSQAKVFAEAFIGLSQEVSMAELQNHLLRYRTDAYNSIDHLQDLRLNKSQVSSLSLSSG